MSKYYKAITVTVASVTAVYLVGNSSLKEKKLNASWTTNYEPSVKWNANWDRRDPASLMKPKNRHFSSQNSEANKENQPNDANKTVDDFEMNKHSSKATRHLFLIRHGQYEVKAKEAHKMILTQLGNEQADLTGKRLNELASNKFKFTKLTNSTMIRAIQTADNILKHLPDDLPRHEDPLLCEGAPIPPEPPVGHWKPEVYFYEDGSRIEAAFRKFFHRAPPEQIEDSYEIIVCHANVIRYFFCRALQFPPEAWLRFDLKHGDGRVGCRGLGDSGHIPASQISS